MLKENVIRILKEMGGIDGSRFDVSFATRNNCRILDLDFLVRKSNWNVENDLAMGWPLRYESEFGEDFLRSMETIAFGIFTELAKGNCLGIPNEEQMSRMMAICGYNAEEMGAYAKNKLEQIMKDQMTSVLPGRSHIQVVCLLSRSLSDAMSDASVCHSYKNGRRRVNYTPGRNQSMQRVKDLLSYLDEQGLLCMDDDGCDAAYEEFVVNHAWYNYKTLSLAYQEDFIFYGINHQREIILDDTMGLTDKFIGHFQKEYEEFTKEFNNFLERARKDTTGKIEELIARESLPLIAKGTLRGILAGDDIYLFELGRYTMEDIYFYSGNTNADAPGNLDTAKNAQNQSLGFVPASVIAYPEGKVIRNERIEEMKAKIQKETAAKDEILRQIKTAIEDNKDSCKEYICIYKKIRKLQDQDIDLGNDFVSRFSEKTRSCAGKKYWYGEEGCDSICIRGEADEIQEELLEARLQEVIDARNDADYDLRGILKENKKLRHEFMCLERKYEELVRQKNSMKKDDAPNGKKSPEKDLCGDDAISVKSKDKAGASKEFAGFAGEDSVQFPCCSGKKVVFFGETDKFQRELKDRYLKDINIPKGSLNASSNMIKNADFAFLNINHVGHSESEHFIDLCRKSHVPVHKLTCKNVRKNALEILSVICKS